MLINTHQTTDQLYAGFAAFPGGFPAFRIQSSIRDVPSFGVPGNFGSFSDFRSPANYPNFNNQPNFGGSQYPMHNKNSMVGGSNGLPPNSGHISGELSLDVTEFFFGIFIRSIYLSFSFKIRFTIGELQCNSTHNDGKDKR